MADLTKQVTQMSTHAADHCSGSRKHRTEMPPHLQNAALIADQVRALKHPNCWAQSSRSSQNKHKKVRSSIARFDPLMAGWWFQAL